MFKPELSNEATELLRILARRSAVPGTELMKEAGLSSPDDLTKPIEELQKAKLIQVEGAVRGSSAPFAWFTVAPSAKDYVHRLLERL